MSSFPAKRSPRRPFAALGKCVAMARHATQHHGRLYMIALAAPDIVCCAAVYKVLKQVHPVSCHPSPAQPFAATSMHKYCIGPVKIFVWGCYAAMCRTILPYISVLLLAL